MGDHSMCRTLPRSELSLGHPAEKWSPLGKLPAQRRSRGRRKRRLRVACQRASLPRAEAKSHPPARKQNAFRGGNDNYGWKVKGTSSYGCQAVWPVRWVSHGAGGTRSGCSFVRIRKPGCRAGGAVLNNAPMREWMSQRNGRLPGVEVAHQRATGQHVQGPYLRVGNPG